jgi:hypothetical protein
VSGLRPLDESQWLGFEEKLMGNSWGIVEDPDPGFSLLNNSQMSLNWNSNPRIFLFNNWLCVIGKYYIWSISTSILSLNGSFLLYLFIFLDGPAFCFGPIMGLAIFPTLQTLVLSPCI